MTAHINYRTILPGAFATVVREAWPALGVERLSAWLEAPMRVKGLKLHDGEVEIEQIQGWLSEQTDDEADYWPQGHLFGALGELRWELISDEVHVVVITDVDEAQLPGGYAGQWLPLDQRADERLFLWGSHSTAKGWSEDRIPELRYPSKWHGPYAAVHTRRYELTESAARPYDSIVVRYLSFNGNIPRSAVYAAGSAEKA